MAEGDLFWYDEKGKKGMQKGLKKIPLPPRQYNVKGNHQKKND